MRVLVTGTVIDATRTPAAGPDEARAFFAAMVVIWTRRGDVATVPPLLVPPTAAADLGDALARAALARDLHDVVAHNISVINVQANTALHLMDRQPERARTALTTINEVSRQALVELRSVLGVLRAVDESAPRAPAPGLARLGDLADTNATIRIAYREGALVVDVDDDGALRPPAQPPGQPNRTGSGIAGMTERAAALGGTLQAGPRPGGGFAVRAWLPLHQVPQLGGDR